jgi:replicative DNA helicase
MTPGEPAFVAPPHSPEAEAKTVGLALASPRALADAIGTQLEPEHFHLAPYRMLYAELQQAYYSDEPVDALSIAERIKRPLARITGVDEREAVQRVQRLAAGQRGAIADVAAIVRRHSDARAILDLAQAAIRSVQEGEQDPSELAGSVAHEAMRIATATTLSHELYTFDQLGPRVIERLRIAKAAREQGMEVGAYFGLSFIDAYVRGLRPSELFYVAGEPGAGKSAVTWVAAVKFAERQLRKPREKRVGTLVLSLEMAEEPATDRLATGITAIDGGKLREGRFDQQDLQKMVDEWHLRKDLPLIFNFSSNMKASAMRALIVEAIRRHNVGVVVIDHLRYVDMDPPAGRRSWKDQQEAEEALSRFLKQDIATQLNVAVICLAHTVKLRGDDGRPSLADLRGGQMVSANADHVAFVYRPYFYASQRAIEAGDVKRTDAEMIFAKNRHGNPGTADFHFDPSIMHIY